MERTIRDIITRVQGLRDRIEEQPIHASKDQLNAIHLALRGLLQRVHERAPRDASA